MTPVPTDDSSFLRDLDSNALINSDVTSFQQYKSRRKKIKEEEKEHQARYDFLLNKVEELSKIVKSLQENTCGNPASQS